MTGSSYFKAVFQQDAGKSDGFWMKTYHHPEAISLPVEYEALLKQNGRVYRIEKSNSGLRWVLTVDDGTWGWDQKGDYVRTLKGHTLEQALEDALEKCWELGPFFLPDAVEWESGDPNFKRWLENL
jgi:hypothetical protein